MAETAIETGIEGDVVGYEPRADAHGRGWQFFNLRGLEMMYAEPGAAYAVKDGKRYRVLTHSMQHGDLLFGDYFSVHGDTIVMVDTETHECQQ